MKEKLIRFAAISFSALLLMASAGVIFWIARDEHARLAEREQAALQEAEEAAREEARLVGANTGEGESEKMLHDIDTLISGLSMDDLPGED